MKQCAYCGRENEEAAVACAECGTGMPTAEPELEPQLSDPLSALVIVRSFDTLEQASLLSARLVAAGIEACIPESGTQPFSQVMPLSAVTVRVAARDREAAEVIAVGMSETEPIWVAAGPGDSSTQLPRLRPQTHRLRLTMRAMAVITTIIVGVPIIFGVVAHSVRTTAAMGPLFWLWALFSIVCFFWGRYAYRRYRGLAWACLTIAALQTVSFSVLFWTVDLPVNTQSQPYAPAHTRNPHNW